MKTCVKVALFSCLLNVFLMAAKYFLGEASASMALKADAVHSLANVISSLSILAGILISDRKTKTFPLGLYKVENLVALLSSFLILFAAYEIVHGALHSIRQGLIQNLGIVTAGIVLMLLVVWLYSRYELKAGLKAGSPSLVADAKHIATDMLSLMVILIAILGTYFGIPLDRYVAVLIAALVARTALIILVDSLKVLMDATLDNSTLIGIREIMESHPLVITITSLGGRSSGRFKFVEADVKIDARLLRDAHKAVTHLEEEILDRWPDIDRILIHYEPEQQEFILISAPIDAPKGARPELDSMLSEHFGEAPFFAVLRKETCTGNVAFETFIENRFNALERQRGVKAAELLAEAGVDEVWTRAAVDGKGAGYALEAPRSRGFHHGSNYLE
jgi:cation diffusion facilitator family transporter